MKSLGLESTSFPTWLAVFVLISVFPMAAQNSQGTVLGHVVDPSGAAVTGASMTIVNLATSVRLSAKTSSVGDYVFVNMIPGNYSLTVEMPGFKKAEAPRLKVDVDATLRQDFRLEVGTVNEQMTVTSDTQ